jgi:hypothetical protein
LLSPQPSLSAQAGGEFITTKTSSIHFQQPFDPSKDRRAFSFSPNEEAVEDFAILKAS